MPIGTSIRPAANHFSGEREGLGTLAFLGPDCGEFLGAVANDPRNRREGFDVVDERRFAPETGLGRERRPESRHPAAAFDCGHQRRLLAADKRARAFDDFEFEVHPGPHDVFPEITAFLTLSDGVENSLGGERILGTDVEESFVRADHVGGDDHALDHAKRERLEDHAVHERPRVAFVAVADDVLGLVLFRAGESPLQPGWETGPAASAQSAIEHFLNDALGIVALETLFHRHKTVVLDVVVDAAWIEHPRMLGHTTDLRTFEAGVDLLTNILGKARRRIPVFIGEQSSPEDGTRSHPSGAANSRAGNASSRRPRTSVGLTRP